MKTSIITCYLKLETNPPANLSKVGLLNSPLNLRKAKLMGAMTIKALNVASDLLAIKKAIDIYRSCHRKWKHNDKQISMTAQEFLGRVPKDISTLRLKYLVENYQSEFCFIAQAKKIYWEKSEYRSSGSGVFGRNNNKRGRYFPSEIVFEF